MKKGRETHWFISPFFSLEFLPNQKKQTWKQAVDRDILELKKRISLLERSQILITGQRGVAQKALTRQSKTEKIVVDGTDSVWNQSVSGRSNSTDISFLESSPRSLLCGTDSVCSLSPTFQRAHKLGRSKHFNRFPNVFPKRRSCNMPLTSRNKMPSHSPLQFRATKSTGNPSSSSKGVEKLSCSKGHVRRSSIPVVPFVIKSPERSLPKKSKTITDHPFKMAARGGNNHGRTHLRRVPTTFSSGNYFGNGYYNPHVQYSSYKPRTGLYQTHNCEDQKVENDKVAPLVATKTEQSHEKNPGVKAAKNIQKQQKHDDNMEKLKVGHGTTSSFRDIDFTDVKNKRRHIRKIIRMALATKQDVKRSDENFSQVKQQCLQRKI